MRIGRMFTNEPTDCQHYSANRQQNQFTHHLPSQRNVAEPTMAIVPRQRSKNTSAPVYRHLPSRKFATERPPHAKNTAIFAVSSHNSAIVVLSAFSYKCWPFFSSPGPKSWVKKSPKY